MKIGILNFKNVFKEPRAWSGTLYQLAQVLKKDHQVEWVGPLRLRHYYNFLDMFFDLKSAITQKHFDRKFSVIYSKIAGKVIGTKLKNRKYDILFAPIASSEMAFLTTDIPIIYLNDSTFASIVNYYSCFLNWAVESKNEANILEKMALEKSTAVIMSSLWAKNSTCNDYQVSPEKVFVLKFGANQMEKPPNRTDLKVPDNSKLQLLFIGVEWERKGGTIAVDTVVQLNRMGHPAELTIIGSNPPINHEYIKVIPFLDKAKPEQFEQLYRILLQTDFFLLPTRAECAGIVFSEASAFGIPSITTDTGGIPDYVENGVNGYRLPLATGADEYASLIASIYSDNEQYLKLRYQARKKYETELNWDTWLKKFNHIAEMITADR